PRYHLNRQKVLVAPGGGSEPAIAVGPPAPRRPILLHRTGVGAAGSHAHPVVRFGALPNGNLGPGLGPVAEPAVSVASPAPQRAVGLQRAGVVRAGGDRAPVGGERGLLDRGGAGDGGVVAELAAAISPPAPEGAVGLHR